MKGSGQQLPHAVSLDYVQCCQDFPARYRMHFLFSLVQSRHA